MNIVIRRRDKVEEVERAVVRLFFDIFPEKTHGKCLCHPLQAGLRSDTE